MIRTVDPEYVNVGEIALKTFECWKTMLNKVFIHSRLFVQHVWRGTLTNPATVNCNKFNLNFKVLSGNCV